MNFLSFIDGAGTFAQLCKQGWCNCDEVLDLKCYTCNSINWC